MDYTKPFQSDVFDGHYVPHYVVPKEDYKEKLVSPIKNPIIFAVILSVLVTVLYVLSTTTLKFGFYATISIMCLVFIRDNYAMKELKI